MHLTPDIRLRMMPLKTLCGMLALCWLTSNCDAQQVVLGFKDQPATSNNVVRIGDLVEILGGANPSVDAWLQIPLGPAPLEKSHQIWHSADIQQHLELRGVHPSGIRWSGPTRTQLTRVVNSQSSKQDMRPAFLQQRNMRQAESLVGQAISEYLAFKSGQPTDFQIQVMVPDQWIAKLQYKRNIVSIGGGQEPWYGPQQFALNIKDGDRQTIIQVKADVQLPPMVVAARRPLRRGEILSADALTYRSLTKQNRRPDTEYFNDMDAVIGKQVRRAVSTGLPLSDQFVGDPILIARNALIQIESVAGSVVVSSQARAIGSGSRGDLIEVELLSNRQRLHATIVDSLTVRVSAQPNRTR